jgi:site-specific recombinase XerD
METKSINFKDLKSGMEESLFAMGYSPITVEWYHRTWFRLEKFMLEQGETMYSPETGATFLKKELDAGHYIRSLKATRIALRRLDDFVHGEFYLAAPKVYSVPDCFSVDFNAYMADLRLSGKRESTITHHHYHCMKILQDFHASHIDNLLQIKPQSIYEVFSGSNNKINISSTLRSFLKYLFKSGVHKNDFSVFVPSPVIRQPVPSVYTKEETDQLLSIIDADKNPGKRNLAIILLALRLGIRSGDIVNLKLSDIDFQSDEIKFIQCKTGMPQRLAFLPELKSAISSYLSGGRPETDCPNLFISDKAPFRPVSVSAITCMVTHHIKKSGIDVGNRKCGGHVLRMTLASELVSEKVPYDVVRKILGHENSASMKHYVKFDVGMLRSCALEVPPLSGLYAEYMNNCNGGK